MTGPADRPDRPAPDSGADPRAGARDDDAAGTASALAEALAGRFDRWRWSAGLTPTVVGAALGGALTLGPVQFGGRALRQTVVTVATQPHPVRLRWDADDELALAELAAPLADPSWPEVLDALGAPTVTFDRGRGPFPGSIQRCHLDRGLTVFDGGGLGYQAVWLYPPLAADDYADRTGAFEPVRRTRR